MSQYIRHFATPLALSAALIVGACGTRDSASDTALASDTSALNRDLARAVDTTSQAALKDVPAAPAPTATKTATTPPKRTTTASSGTTTRTPTPTKTASGNTVTKSNPASTGGAASTGGGAVGMIESGTTVNLASNQKICTNTHSVGQTFQARVAEAVTGSNGAVIPAGATANVTITELKKSENVNDQIRIGLAVNSVSFGGNTYPVSSEITSAAVTRDRASSRGNDAKKVAAGAAIGAIAGQVIGKNTKGTVIGAAAGAAAGAGAAVATADYNGCINEGGRIQIRLNNGIQVRA